MLRKGTERGYRSLDFTAAGDKLASVGQAPDYMLTIWDWARERVLLRCKAFGQDVFKVGRWTIRAACGSQRAVGATWVAG